MKSPDDMTPEDIDRSLLAMAQALFTGAQALLFAHGACMVATGTALIGNGGPWEQTARTVFFTAVLGFAFASLPMIGAIIFRAEMSSHRAFRRKRPRKGEAWALFVSAMLMLLWLGILAFVFRPVFWSAA